MRRGRVWWWAWALGGAMAIGVAWPARAVEPMAGGELTDALRRFYGWVLAHPGKGLPTVRQRAQLATLVTPSLSQLLKQAADTEARCIRQAERDEKPLLMEGDLFVSHHEGATEVDHGPVVQVDENHALAEMYLVSLDPRFPKAHPYRMTSWSDTVELQREGGRWRVHNLRLEGQTLSASLRDYINAGEQICTGTTP
ncbi:MAG: hypothetical protein V4739_14320 [Pseudomonadota bacterium]